MNPETLETLCNEVVPWIIAIGGTIIYQFAVVGPSDPISNLGYLWAFAKTVDVRDYSKIDSELFHKKYPQLHRHYEQLRTSNKK